MRLLLYNVSALDWLLAIGCWLLAVGCWLLAIGCWLSEPLELSE